MLPALFLPAYLAVVVTTASIIRYPADPFHLLRLTITWNRVDLDACHSLRLTLSVFKRFGQTEEMFGEIEETFHQLQKETLANDTRFVHDLLNPPSIENN